jgi:hypothetical protein
MPRRSAGRRSRSQAEIALAGHALHMAPIAKPPSSRKKAALNALSTGNTMNSASRLAQPTTAAATNRSPLKNPRRATPNAASMSSAVSATKPPQPMPGWRAPSSPKAAVRAFERPAARTDGESRWPAAPANPGSRRPAAQRPGAGPRALQRADGGHQQAQQAQPQPGAPVARRLHQAVAGLLLRKHLRGSSAGRWHPGWRTRAGPGRQERLRPPTATSACWWKDS